MGLPVIVERNAWTLPQERYNTVWVREKQVGLVLSNFSGIAEAVAELLAPENFARFRNHVQGIQNRALFEIPPIFQNILERGQNIPGRGQSVREPGRDSHTGSPDSADQTSAQRPASAATTGRS